MNSNFSSKEITTLKPSFLGMIVYGIELAAKEKKSSTKKVLIIALPIIEALNAFYYASATLIQMPFALMTSSIYLITLLNPKKDFLLEKILHEFPGVHSVLRNALKTVICVVNIFVGPSLALTSPSLNRLLHEYFHLVEEDFVIKANNDQKKSIDKIIGFHSLKEKMNQVVEIIKNDLNKPSDAFKINTLVIYGRPGSGKKLWQQAFMKTLNAHALGTIRTTYQFHHLSADKEFEKIETIPTKHIRNYLNQRLKFTRENIKSNNMIIDIMVTDDKNEINILKKISETDKRIVLFEIPLPDNDSRKELFISRLGENFDDEELSRIVDKSKDLSIVEILSLIENSSKDEMNEETIELSIDEMQKKVRQKHLLESPVETKEVNKTLDDYIGGEEIKKVIREKIANFKNRKNREKLHLLAPTGILFEGPSGSGKTLLAECVANELEALFMIAGAGSLADSYMHGTTKKIFSIFNEAKELAIKRGKPVVLFFDEIDAVAKPRGPGHGNFSDYANNEETTALLTELNNSANNNIFVIGATNHLDLVDEAVKRPGRLYPLTIPYPDDISRKQIFESMFHFKNFKANISVELNDDDYSELVNLTTGYSQADLMDIKSLVLEPLTDQILAGEEVVITKEMVYFQIKFNSSNDFWGFDE